MSMQLSTMLATWAPRRDADDWVLGTVFKTEGSSYRKPGAMTLISAEGAQLGLLSGGCLEADIRLNARKVMSSGLPLTCFLGICFVSFDLSCCGSYHLIDSGYCVSFRSLLTDVLLSLCHF